MLERTDATTNEVLEPITFVAAYLTVFGFVHPPFSICVHTANTDDFRALTFTFILMTSETCLCLPIIAAALLLYAFCIRILT
jgi:hypothetical protein